MVLELGCGYCRYLFRKNGSIIGQIETDGTIRRNGSIWGPVSDCCGDHDTKRAVAAVLVFFTTDFFLEANHNKKWRNYPFVAYLHHYEKPELFGCLMGGLSHFYINTSGDVLPCPFLQVSFGNIIEEEFLNIYARMRNAVPFPLKKECPSFHIADKLFTINTGNIPSLVPYTNIKKEWDQMYT